MAKAPRPTPDGVEAQREQTRRDRLVTVFTVKDAAYPLALRNVPVSEKVAVRAAVGMSWEEVMGLAGQSTPGIDSVAVAAWLSRRAHGERVLSWPQFCAEWDDTVTIGDVTIESVDPDADASDPEA